MKIKSAFILILPLFFVSSAIAVPVCGGLPSANKQPILLKETKIQTDNTENLSSKKIETEDNTSPCEVAITADDSMAFSTNELTIKKSCDKFMINFENNGVIPKATMGHNVVISKKSDTNALTSEGMSSGVEHDYLPPNDKRILAKTPILGGGEKSSVTFSTEVFSKDEEYQFFCSFPGHFFTMKGKVIVE